MQVRFLSNGLLNLPPEGDGNLFMFLVFPFVTTSMFPNLYYRPLSKTVRFNVLKVIPAGSSGGGKKAFTGM